MPDLRRITRTANGLYWVATILLPVLPLIVVIGLVRGWADPGWLMTAFPGLPAATAPSGMKSTAVLVLGALTLIPITMALAQMRALFARYRAGEILTPPCARHILRSGRALMGLAVLQMVILPLQILVLTADNPPGQRIVSLSLNSETLWLLLAGGLLVTIGWVMTEAARAAEENAGFV